MASAYPGSIDSFTPKVDNVDDVMAVDVNELQDSIVAVETELGTDPAGAYATVVARFNALDTGWMARSETWTRTGNHAFTVTSALLTSAQLLVIYSKNTKVTYNDGATDYGVIISSTSAGANSISVSLAVNSDYAMAAVTITAQAISYIENPTGYPKSGFNYAPTPTPSAGSLSNITITTAKFIVINGGMFFWHDVTCDLGGATALEIQVPLPITPLFASAFTAATRDASSGAVPLGTGVIGAAIGTGYRLASGSNWSIGTSKRFYGSGFILF